MQKLFGFFVFIVTAFIFGDVRSQTHDDSKPLPPIVLKTQERFEGKMAELKEPGLNLRENYSKRLGVLLKEAQANGDLKSALLFKSEIEAVTSSDGNLKSKLKDTEETPRDLVTARRIFEREQKRLDQLFQRNAVSVVRVYKLELEKLRSEITKLGDLDAAVEIDKLLSDLPSFGTSRNKELTVKVRLDGLSFLLMQGDKLWFDHSKGTVARPGKHGGDFPTYLNNTTEWLPEWDDKITKPFKTDIFFLDDQSNSRVRVKLIGDQKATISVEEQPSEENEYTAKIRMHYHPMGSAWVEFSAKW